MYIYSYAAVYRYIHIYIYTCVSLHISTIEPPCGPPHASAVRSGADQRLQWHRADAGGVAERRGRGAGDLCRGFREKPMVINHNYGQSPFLIL